MQMYCKKNPRLALAISKNVVSVLKNEECCVCIVYFVSVLQWENDLLRANAKQIVRRNILQTSLKADIAQSCST